jgi:hypothetical protein
MIRMQQVFESNCLLPMLTACQALQTRPQEQSWTSGPATFWKSHATAAMLRVVGFAEGAWPSHRAAFVRRRRGGKTALRQFASTVCQAPGDGGSSAMEH